jgi:hypothetical protein
MTPLQMELHAARKERLARMNVTPRPNAVLVSRAHIEQEIQGPPAPSPIEVWWRELEESSYPIHDKWGKELYCINRPECWGSGDIECDDPEEPKAEPPDPNQMVLSLG